MKPATDLVHHLKLSRKVGFAVNVAFKLIFPLTTIPIECPNQAFEGAGLLCRVSASHSEQVGRPLTDNPEHIFNAPPARICEWLQRPSQACLTLRLSGSRGSGYGDGQMLSQYAQILPPFCYVRYSPVPLNK